MDLEKFDAIAADVNEHKARLIAVSKTKPEALILEVYRHGHRLFGENKAQEMLRKYEDLPKDIQWHLIGHLQTNKVKFIAPFVAMIHSVDSGKLLLEIEKQAQKNNRRIDVLLQIHIAQEETKFGWTKEEAEHFLEHKNDYLLPHVRICGLMGMATNTDDEAQIRSEFRGLKTFFDQVKQKYFSGAASFCELSMGMSSDYPIALQEGATLVRVGSLIFGERQYY